MRGEKHPEELPCKELNEKLSLAQQVRKFSAKLENQKITPAKINSSLSKQIEQTLMDTALEDYATDDEAES